MSLLGVFDRILIFLAALMGTLGLSVDPIKYGPRRGAECILRRLFTRYLYLIQ